MHPEFPAVVSLAGVRDAFLCRQTNYAGSDDGNIRHTQYAVRDTEYSQNMGSCRPFTAHEVILPGRRVAPQSCSTELLHRINPQTAAKCHHKTHSSAHTQQHSTRKRSRNFAFGRRPPLFQTLPQPLPRHSPSQRKPVKYSNLQAAITDAALLLFFLTILYYILYTISFIF